MFSHSVDTPLPLSAWLQSARERMASLPLTPSEIRSELLWMLSFHLQEDAARLLIMDSQFVLSPYHISALETMLQRRIQQREPLQYILGEAVFYGRTFHVNPSVLIPRPETEGMVEDGLRWMAAQKRPLRILDLGTGSGAILLSLLAGHGGNMPCRGVGIDCSEGALEVAHHNQKRLNIRTEQVSWFCGDWWKALPEGEAPFDMIVSNPPYIDPAHQGDMDDEVLCHEPLGALFAPQDCDYFYVQTAEQLNRFLAPQGQLWMEVEAGAASRVETILSTVPGVTLLETLKDIQGIPRIVRVFME